MGVRLVLAAHCASQAQPRPLPLVLGGRKLWLRMCFVLRPCTLGAWGVRCRFMLYYMQNCQRNYFGAHNAPMTRSAFHECDKRNCAAPLHDYCTFVLAHAKVNK